MSTPVTDGVLASLTNLTQDGANTDAVNLLSSYAGLFDFVYSLVADQGYADDPDFVPGWSTLLNPDTCPTAFLPYLALFNGTDVPPGMPDQLARQIIKSESGMQRGTVAAISSAALRFLSGTSTLVGTLQELGTTDLPLNTSGPISAIPVNPLRNQLAPQTITLIDPTDAHQQQWNVQAAVQPGATEIDVYPQTPNYAYPVGTTVWGPFLYVQERWNGTLSTSDPYHLTLGYRPEELVNLVAMKAAVNLVKPAGVIIDYIGSDNWTWSQATGTWAADTMSWAQTATTQP